MGGAGRAAVLPNGREPNPLSEQSKYQYVSTLGRGAFGFVQLANHTELQELVAIKCLKRTELNKYVEGEIVNHSLLRHPHVIQFKDVFLTREYICIVMEYACGGSLFQYVQKQGSLKEAVARWFFQQLIVGVDYCHKCGVANRDIKLENTLLQNINNLPLPLLKICDFGYSKADFKSAAKSKVGTLTYMAPEVLIPSSDGKYNGKVADIWSCGVMLYVMLCGSYPFAIQPTSDARATDVFSILEQMVAQRYVVSEHLGISYDCLDLLQRMLLPTPAARIQLEDVMQHSWFRSNLPAEASTMNGTYLRAPPNLPLLEQIRRVIEEARQSAFANGSLAEDRTATALQREAQIQRAIEAAVSAQLASRQTPSDDSMQSREDDLTS